jgi:hypothetical protein
VKVGLRSDAERVLIVIPAEAGIQHSMQIQAELDPGLCRDDEQSALQSMKCLSHG